MKKNIHLQAAEQKIFMETKVTYIDPDYTAAQDLKRRTIEGNKRFNEYLEDRKQAEEDGYCFSWDEIEGGEKS